MNVQKKAKRIFTAEQKADILRKIQEDLRSGMTVTKALEKAGIVSSLYSKWKRQFEVGIRSSLRNGKPPVDRAKKQLEKRVAKLEKIVVEQAAIIADLKKETNWE